MWLNEDKTEFGFIHNDLEIGGNVYNTYKGIITFNVVVIGGGWKLALKLDYKQICYVNDMENFLVDDIKKFMRDTQLTAFQEIHNDLFYP